MNGEGLGAPVTGDRASAGNDQTGAGASPVVTRDSSLTIGDAALLRQSLLDAIRDGQSVRVDASDVEMIDATGLQLFVAAFVSAADRGVQLSLEQPSHKLVDAARMIGLADALGLPTR